LSVLPDWTVVGFTGHRTIPDASAMADRVSGVLGNLAAAHSSLLAVSSLASGADTVFVREVARRGIPFMLVLPFPPERFRQDFAPGEWASVAGLLEQAAHVDVVRAAASDDEAYMEAGARVVDQADVVLAVWDGQPTAGLGGTGDVVTYARELGKPLVLLHPETGALVRERAAALPGGAPGALDGSPRLMVQQHFQELDAVATRAAPSVRHLIQRIVVLHLLATVLGVTVLVLHIEGLVGYAVALLEVAVLAVAFVLSTRGRQRHGDWMRARIEAELCRSSLATWPMRERIERIPRVAIQGFERPTRNLRLAQLLDPSPAPALEAARQEYLDGRVRDQIGYFTRRCQEALRSSRLLRRLAMTGTVLAALLSAGRLVLSLLGREGPTLAVAELLSLVLPLVSAALLSLVLTQEFSRRASRYQEMVDVLEAAERRIRAVRIWPGLTEAATETEEALLNEAVEWQMFRRFASAPH
jgi:hypothetical protein